MVFEVANNLVVPGRGLMGQGVIAGSWIPSIAYCERFGGNSEYNVHIQHIIRKEY
jgi:hypothetical protein